MRNWLIAMVVSGTLTGPSYTASAQEIKRAGSGFAKAECFASWGSCGGLGPETCSGPDCNVSVSGNGTIFPGFDGQANLNMSANSIQVSGNASFTPPSPCGESTFIGGPGYIADGSQSVYADVPNGTPIRITIISSLSGSGGGGATWSDAKSGAGGVSGTTVFNAVAGPGKITDSGVDYYLIDTIQARGNAGASRNCDEPNNQSFNGSLSMSFCVAAGKMKAASPTGLTAMVNTPVELKVQVNNGCTNAPLSGQSISFSGVDPAEGQNFALPSSAQTDADGFATVSFTLGSGPGVYSVNAICASCGANRQITFSVTALTTEQARALEKVYGDGTGPVGSRLDNPLTVRVINTVTGDSEPGGINVDFDQDPPKSCPDGFAANPNFTATNPKGIAKSIVSLPQLPGSCIYKAYCATCLGNKAVLFSVEATARPELDVSAGGGGSGDSRSGGGPSPAGGRGDENPLVMQYGRAGSFIYTSPPAPAGFVGLLTGDQAQFKAVPPAGTLEWTRDGAVFASGPEASVTFNQLRLIDTPTAIMVRRTDDGKTESVNVIVEQRPTGIGDNEAYARSAFELCTNPLDVENYEKCRIMMVSEIRANTWAEMIFEPAGRSLTKQQGYSCRNNCCDAAKHTFWQAIITKRVGLAYSQRHGIAHEVSGLVENESNATVMDLHNNRLGQLVGGATSALDYEAIGSEVLPRIRGGQALVLFNPRNNGKTSLLERSFQCAQ